tara:strand:+ start:1385 stop:1561 length:177 start_codon:yes stop_codon:yes gene_type:complete
MSKEYKLIVSDNRRFEDVINRYLEEGWELFGSPFCEGQRYLQSMLREKKATVKKKVIK